jgi:hypothetical protein
MGAAPSAVPTGNPGQNAAGLSQVRAAIDILTKALPSLHSGSEPWKAVMNAMTSLGKFVPPSAEVPGVQRTTAQGLAQDANKNAMMDMVNKSLSPTGASAGAGGAPPPSGPPAPAAPPQPQMPPSLAA